mmetsp:Transcript_24365/g.96635  ORF Transcript_24365/g.96635 Transcript_24365/m.96635 type:complete len:242 (+) Transcript_24365:92-817(+)
MPASSSSASAGDPASEDYYRVLGVARGADEAAIKKAYKKAAIRWHPDKNPGDASAEEKFKRVAEAFDVLGDAQKRAAYDRWGKAGTSGAAASPFRANAGAPVDPDEIFRQFFGGGGAPGASPFGGPGGAAFFVNGVPINLHQFGGFSRPRRARANDGDADNPAQAFEIPPAVQQLVRTVPAPLLMAAGFACFFLALQLFSAVASALLPRLQLVLPVMFLAPKQAQMPLLAGLVVLSLLGVV